MSINTLIDTAMSLVIPFGLVVLVVIIALIWTLKDKNKDLN